MPSIFVILTSLWVILGFVSLVRALRRRRPLAAPAAPAATPVTVLKPLSGVDPSLSENLESFFVQDHPAYEIVFGVADPSDPAIRIVEALRAKHPGIPSRIVVDPAQSGMNPKVANLRSMVRFAAYDAVVISDSNVRVPRGYLRQAADAFAETNVGLITHVFAGVGERTLWARLENVQLNGFVAAGTALPTLLGDPAVVGKSMLFSRRTFDALGGFDSVADVLAEDFLMGKMFQHAGYAVRIAPTVIQSVNGSVSREAFLKRQLRWSMLRFRLNPLAFLLEPVASPIAMLPFALAVLGPWALLWAALLVALRDGAQWALLRGRSGAVAAALLGPVRDLIMLGTWFLTPFVKHVSWRGHRVRLGTGTRAFVSA